MATNINDNRGGGADTDPSVEDHEAAVVGFAMRGELVPSNAPLQATYS